MVIVGKIEISKRSKSLKLTKIQVEKNKAENRNTTGDFFRKDINVYFQYLLPRFE